MIYDVDWTQSGVILPAGLWIWMQLPKFKSDVSNVKC